MKILVIRLSSLGDVILTTSIFPNLKAADPSAEIFVVTKPNYRPVFDRNPDVDYVIEYPLEKSKIKNFLLELRNLKFDFIVDLHSNIRSRQIRNFLKVEKSAWVNKQTWARWLLVHFKIRSKKLKRSVKDRYLDVLRNLEIPIVSGDTRLYPSESSPILSRHGIEPNDRFIALAPGAQHSTKRWPADRFAEAGNRLAAAGNRKVLILGSAGDKAVAQEVVEKLTVPFVDLTGKTSLPELFTILSKAEFLLTNDSGIMHAAEALKIPLVVIFGPTVRDFGFAPYRDSSKVVEVVNLKCRPCSFHGDLRCPLGHHKCMNDVDLNAVLFAASMNPKSSGMNSEEAYHA